MARVVLPGVAHHVAQRGMRSRPIFGSDADRREYVGLLDEQGRRLQALSPGRRRKGKR